MLAMVLSLQFAASATADYCRGLPTTAPTDIPSTSKFREACSGGNELIDGYHYKYSEETCSSAYDCELQNMAPPCAEEEQCSRVELYAGKGKPGEYGYQASRYGWCCRTISETAGPQIDVCDPHTDDICECYSIATRTTKCRTPDGQIINGARGGRIIDPKECEFGFTDELGLRCSVVWSTNDQRCGLSYKGTHDEFCDDHFGDRDSCQTSSCCLWSNGGSTCKGWSSTTCNIYRTWSREELERVSALKCPSGGRKLNANMISSTVCLKRNGHSAEDCWNIGCLRCVLIVCAV